MPPEMTAVDPRVVRAERDAICQEVLSGDLLALDAPGRYTDFVDGWLRELFASAVGDREAGYALIAVGGHGRRALCPRSDLDLVLVHRRRRHYKEVADHIWYAVWDTTLHLDHSVRSPNEVLQMARSDLRVALGWLDARLIAGDEEMALPLIEQARALWPREATHFLPELAASIAERHRTAGEMAFLLEPDLKEAAGGLRDLGALRAMAAALPELAAIAQSDAVLRAERTITAARVVIHSRTASLSDRLALQEQDEVADVLRYRDADKLMAEISEAGRTIAARTAQALRRMRASTVSSKNPAPPPVDLGRGLVVAAGEISLAESVAVAGDEAVLLRVALAAATRGALIDEHTLDRLEADAPAPKEPWSENVRNDFIALLSTGDAVVPVIEALDQRHLFERLLPEWTAVRNRPQRNAYHRYTVDRHLLEAVARAAEHLGEVSRPDLLVLGALLHDIGKGQPGDHSEVGTAIADVVMRRLGFPDDDIETVCDLVAYHLVLPEFATRRDLDDPSTIAVVARLAKDRSRLSLLAALVAADGQATGSAAWGTWKAELVGRLVEKVAVVLDGNPIPEPAASRPSAEQAELLDRGELAIRVNGRRVTVIAPDRPGLLAAVAGSLALNRCNVRRASAYEGGADMAVEVFDFDPAFDRPPDWAKIERYIKAALDGTLQLDERLADLERVYARGRRVLAAHPVKAHVTIDNKTSERASIIEIRTPDRIGILYRIANAVAESGLDVVAALVDTLGHEVVDTFYVREPEGGKLVGNPRINSVREILETVVHGAG